MSIEATLPPRPSKHALPLYTRSASEPAPSEAFDAELRAYEAAERERLGLRRARRQWVDSMLKPVVTKRERPTVTLLIAGLTAAQDFLVEAAIRSQGYNVKFIGVPDNDALRVGKEFGNRAQCNPTYFTVGNLVKYLQELRDQQGLSAEAIVRDYVFFTAGACGPCRFGMYVTEYRKALRDAGFEGFRVMLFQQQGGLKQATGEDVGIELNPPFFIAIVKALVCGDVLNALGYRIRPYERNPGQTNAALEEAKKLLYGCLFEQRNVFYALYQCRKLFADIPVDRLRPRAKVSIIGEFWAMTTEGDGNYQLQKFLEQEGGEDDIQLVTAWLLYNIWEVERDTRVREDLRGADGGKRGLEGLNEWGVAKRLATMRVAEWVLRGGFQLFAQPLGLHGYKLPDMNLVAEAAKDYYSNDLRGGEGHMEVGKLIVNSVHAKAHVTVSVKPFGCMPSSGVSDGVQSLIQARYPGSIYCAVETSGDGATNFYSRVQMYMFKARQLADTELQRAYEETGTTEVEVRAFLAENPRYNSPFYHPPHRVAGTAANLVYALAPYITKTRTERLRASLREVSHQGLSLAKRLPGLLQQGFDTLREPAFRARLQADLEVLSEAARGKASETWQPLVDKLSHRAFFGSDGDGAQAS